MTPPMPQNLLADYLLQEMTAQGTTFSQLQTVLNWPAHQVQDVLAGRLPLTPESCILLEGLWGISWGLLWHWQQDIPNLQCTDYALPA